MWTCAAAAAHTKNSLLQNMQAYWQSLRMSRMPIYVQSEKYNGTTAR